MYSFLIFIIMVWLFYLTVSQSARNRETKSFLDNIQMEIERLKEQLAELKNRLTNGSYVSEQNSFISHHEKQKSAAPGIPLQGEIKEKVAGLKKRIAAGVSIPVADLKNSPSKKEAPSSSRSLSEGASQQTDDMTGVFEGFKAEKSNGMPEADKAPLQSDSGVDSRNRAPAFNWENFLGAKMFAWIGGFSLFIGFAFLLKYSLDHNLISPAFRVVTGFVSGIGLVTVGIYLRKKTYEITSQTLSATGIVILYASSFAANAVYHFTGPVFTIVIMSLITAGAFLLAAGTNARVIAVLGIVGGFLTYPILSTGQDQPFALFTYITFLNIGLLCVSFYRRWNFLVALGVLGTILTELYWLAGFFRPDKISVSIAVFLWFDILFCAANWCGKRFKRSDRWLIYSAASLPFVTFIFVLFLVFYQRAGMNPVEIFTCLLVADLCLAAITLTEKSLLKIYLIAGGCVFFILSMWISARMTPELLAWALAGSLIFAFLHSAFPMILARHSSVGVSRYSQIFPLIALLLTLIPIFKGAGDSYLIWPFTLLINGGIMVLAVFTASAWVILGALIVTGIVITGWIFSGTAGGIHSWAAVMLIGAFGAFFSMIATFVLNLLKKKPGMEENASLSDSNDMFGFSNPDNVFLQIPVFSTVLPFMLLILASLRIAVENPASIFGLGFVLTVIAVWLSRYLKAAVLLPVTMGSLFLLELAVHLFHFNYGYSSSFFLFYLISTALFFILPFYYRHDYVKITVPWATAAVSGPLHFFLFYDFVHKTYPNNFMGLLPAVMAILYFTGLKTLIRQVPHDSLKRNSILAWFGGSTLFFVTLIFPVQFDHQWLTIGWALEGLALIWLFRRIPHPGLRGLGVALLLVTFIRLGINPEVFMHYPQSEYPVFNWYLYTYGIAVFCLMAGGRLLAPPGNKVMGINAPPVLYTLGTILAFFLMNIEIADFFSTGKYLEFQFSGDLAQSMSYSIAWALFALALVIIGIIKQLRSVRYAAIGLIGVTLFKLFFFDLRQLDQLYRISAFIGVAIVLIIASVLYQKWVVRKYD